MLRRLYSSLPSSSSSSGRLKSTSASSSSASSSSSLSPTSPKGTRGRSKPSSRSTTLLRSASSSSSHGLSAALPASSTPSQGKIALVGKGRRHRNRSAPGGTLSTHPTARDYTFRPMQIYPAQMILHKALLPPHMPIPVHFGVSSYTRPPPSRSSRSTLSPPAEGEANPLGPFARPSLPSPAPELAKRGGSALADHVNVTSTLSHPSLIQHLGTPFWENVPTPGEYAIMDKLDKHDPEAHLVRIFGEAVVRNTLSAGATWEETLARLGGGGGGGAERDGSSLSTDGEEARLAKGEKAMQVAVEGVTALLSKMAVKDGEQQAEDLGMWMDSVRRKRKKKISKHKYKKRRKATRAQRKRLGK